MRVRVKLMGALTAKSPPDDLSEVGQDASIDDVLTALAIEPAEIQIVMVNGRPQPDRTGPLSESDELTILAPVGGG